MSSLSDDDGSVGATTDKPLGRAISVADQGVGDAGFVGEFARGVSEKSGVAVERLMASTKDSIGCVSAASSACLATAIVGIGSEDG